MRISLGIAVTLVLAVFSSTRADIVITFGNGDSFEGDSANDTAGPFTDPMTGITGTITTGDVSPSGVLNPNAGTLGINASGGDTADRFDDGESWTFEWDVKTFFSGVDFNLFDQGTETFSIQSNDWINLTGVSPASGEVVFTGNTGTFVFSSGSSSDDFDLNDISGGTVLPVNSAGDIFISYSGNATDTAVIADMTFGTPEPSTFILVGIATLAFFGFQLHSNRKRRPSPAPFTPTFRS